MRNQRPQAAVFLAAVCLSWAAEAPCRAQAPVTAEAEVKEEETMTTHARGEFEVELSPQALHGAAADSGLGRMTIDKRFHGDLEAASRGEMLSAGTGVEGSAGYVAIERVRGTLHGRRGTFVLQHSGTMNRGAPRLSVTVVPDSGTGELEGLKGSMTIEVAEGKHTYDFEFTLPADGR